MGINGSDDKKEIIRLLLKKMKESSKNQKEDTIKRECYLDVYLKKYAEDSLEFSWSMFLTCDESNKKIDEKQENIPKYMHNSFKPYFKKYFQQNEGIKEEYRLRIKDGDGYELYLESNEAKKTDEEKFVKKITDKVVGAKTEITSKQEELAKKSATRLKNTKASLLKNQSENTKLIVDNVEAQVEDSTAEIIANQKTQTKEITENFGQLKTDISANQNKNTEAVVNKLNEVNKKTKPSLSPEEEVKKSIDKTKYFFSYLLEPFYEVFLLKPDLLKRVQTFKPGVVLLPFLILIILGVINVTFHGDIEQLEGVEFFIRFTNAFFHPMVSILIIIAFLSVTIYVMARILSSKATLLSIMSLTLYYAASWLLPIVIWAATSSGETNLVVIITQFHVWDLFPLYILGTYSYTMSKLTGLDYLFRKINIFKKYK